MLDCLAFVIMRECVMLVSALVRCGTLVACLSSLTRRHWAGSKLPARSLLETCGMFSEDMSSHAR